MSYQNPAAAQWDEGNTTREDWGVSSDWWEAENGSEPFGGNASVPPFKTPFHTPHIRWTFIILYTLVSAGCVIGNALVIFVILRHRKMRNVTNFLLANLALADLFVGVFCVIPNLTVYISQYWLMGVVMCKLYYFVQSVSYTASVIILTVISMERYLAIIHPMLSKRLTSTCLHGAVVVVVWFIAVIYSLPIPVAYDVFSLSSPDDPSTSVHFCYQMRKLNMKAYVTVNFVLWYVLPLVLMVVMYTSISIVLWRTSSGLPASERFLRRPDTFRLTPTTPTTTGAKDTCVTNTTDLDRCYINQHVGFSSSPRGTPSVSPVFNSWRKFSATPAVARPTRLPVPSLAYDPSRTGYGDRLKVSSPLRNGLGRDPFDGRRQSAGSRSPTSPVCARSLSSPGQRARSPSSPGDALPRTPGQRKSSTELMLRTQTKRRNPLVARRKVIRLLIAIIVSFAACVLPHHVRLLWQTWTTRRHYTHENLLVPPVTFLLFYFNSCLNPFLYAFLSDNFRQSLAQLLSCRRLCRPKGR